MHKTTIGFIYTILGTLSTICGISILVVYVFTKSLQESPGVLIFWHILSQVFIDFSISLTGFYLLITNENEDYHCKYIGAINTYFYFLGVNYVLCLCIEVIKKTQNPMENNFNKRSKFYHIISHLLSLSLALIIWISKRAGPASNHFCMINRKDEIKLIIAIPLALFLPALIFTFLVLYKIQFTTPFVNYFVKKHSIYVTTYFCIWCPVIINIILKNEDTDSWLDLLSVILTSSSGLILTIIRVISYYTAKYIRKLQQKSVNKISIASMINDTIKVMPEAPLLDESYGMQSDYVNVFNSISTESALTAIIILQYSLIYFNKKQPERPTPWPLELYKANTTINIDPKQLDNIKIPRNLKRHYSIQRLEYTEYAAEIFKNIMDLEGITSQDLIHSFDILSLLSDFKSIIHGSEGRSGSFFLYSTDKKYIIKTISSKELKILLSDFLISYHSHLCKYQDSVLSRIIGVYSFKVNSTFNVTFIVMQSVYTDVSVKQVYDLKGSKANRKVQTKKDDEKSKVLKDINFLCDQKKLYLSACVGQRMLEIIENDTKLLKSFNIMDYSLLIAVKTREEYSKFFFKSSKRVEKGYAVGIIDYLQSFNKTKRLEGISKKILTFKPTAHISSINPEDYFDRFLQFVKNIIKIIDTDKQIL